MPRAPERPAHRTTPLRLRLTLAFASAIAIVLAATGILIHVEFARSFDDRVDRDLVERGRTLAELASRSSPADRLLLLSGEALAQIYDRDGRVLASTGRLRGDRLLTRSEVRRAASRPVLVLARRVVGDDGARVRAVALGSGARVAAIAESRQPREVTLHRLDLLLAITLPAALLLASLVGYAVAGAALRPVERMRVQAAAIGAADLHERLPVPRTRDELDRLATTLNDLLDRLHGALERERRIVSDASHELRTPISVLLARLEVALRGGDDPDELREALTGAVHDGQRLSALADALLVLARADQDALPLRRDPLDVQELLEQAARRHGPVAERGGRWLEIEVDVDGGAVVAGDAQRVAQVLDNLVVNALRYGAGPIALRARATADGVELAVCDRGPGFPEDFLPRAFERFSQASAAHGGEGSGLGLALVDAIARAHGGHAAVRNRDGGGAEAAVVLPAA